MAASLEENVSGDWQATFKHHLAFVLQSSDASGSGASAHVAAATLWRKGVLNFIVSAPSSAGGKWRIRLGSRSPIIGDCLLVALAWVGNNYFGHEAIRRGLDTPPFERFSGKVLPNGNVLCGLLTEKAIGQYVAQSFVRLDAEQRRVLADMNTAGDPLLCISALAGTGKTALAHCVLKAFMEGHRNSTPRQLVLYTVPTRTLREEVVLELLKLKADFVSAFCCVCKLL